MPEVSVIIPAYRVTAYIAEALDSVFAQSFRDFNVIVVNDCCPDTEALEGVLAPYRDRIVYLKLERNSGPSAARNTAIRATDAPYIALLDGDDAWEPNYLEAQLGILKTDLSIDVLYCNASLFGDASESGPSAMDLNPSEGAVTFTSLMTLKCNVLVSVTARRDIFLKAGLFEPERRRAEDFDLWLRIVKAGGRIAYHRQTLVRMRRRSDSASANERAMLEADIEVAQKAKRTLKLTEEERTAADSQILKWQSRLEVIRGKEALAMGRMDEATGHFRAAYASQRTPRIAVLAVLARIAPWLLAWIQDRRERP